MVQGHAEVATKSERISSTRRGKRFRSYVAGQKRVSISQSLSDSGLIGKNPLSPIHLSRRSFDEGGTLSSLTLIFPSSFRNSLGFLVGRDRMQEIAVALYQS